MEHQRALIMAADSELLDDLLRLAAAAGCPVERAVDPAAARLSWSAAPLVLLDEPSAHACARARLARRSRVVVVCRGAVAPTVWPRAVAIGAEHVVALPEAESWLVSALADAVEGAVGAGRVLAVVGGRGGAGASVLATAVAVAARREGQRVMLVDCDPLGGGLDLMLGAEDVDGPRWPDLALSEGRIPSASLRAALPVPSLRGAAGPGSLSLLSCDRSGGGPRPGAAVSVLEAGRRGGETVVCDLPRYPTETALAVVDAADLTVLVVPAEVRSTASAARVAATLRERGRPVQLVVRGPAPGGLSARDVAAALGMPLLHAMRPQAGLARMAEQGTPPGAARGPLAAAARAVLDELASGPKRAEAAS